MGYRLALVEDDERFSMPTPQQVDHTLIQLAEFYNRCFQKAQEKGGEYGDAWREQGAIGNLARIMSKVSRLRHMFWKQGFTELFMNVDLLQGQAEDSLIDLPNLCAFMDANLAARNTHGK